MRNPNDKVILVVDRTDGSILICERTLGKKVSNDSWTVYNKDCECRGIFSETVMFDTLIEAGEYIANRSK